MNGYVFSRRSQGCPYWGGERKLWTRRHRRPGENGGPGAAFHIEFDRNKRELSVNIPNEGHAVSNLPEDAIVDIPALVDAQGLHPISVGPLPEAIAARSPSRNCLWRPTARGTKPHTRRHGSMQNANLMSAWRSHSKP
ncbi:MAG TPA: hypothetical protein EYP53_05355 [Candidatus Latescibacteria bacterium]|nr:hypothetical protein [Candidatus Latescibacterota bacterium]